MSFVSFDQAQTMNNLARYATGTAINRQEEPSGIVSGALFMGGVSGANWAWKNRKSFKAGWQNLAKEAAERDKLIRSTNVVPKGKAFSKVRNIWAGASKYVAQKEAAAESAKAAASATSQASKGFFGKTKNALGITKVSKFLTSTAAKHPKFAPLIKGIKGNAGFAIFSLGVGVVLDVIPAFQIGATEGFKQLGKTAMKTTAEVGGWAAGTALGAKAGAAVGTCIGGPIGTAVGTVLGAACGFLGSWLASKAADKVIGPNEVEIAQQKNSENLAQAAKDDAKVQDEVVGQALQNLVANYTENGELSDDDKIAKKSLEKVIGEEINLDELAQEYAAASKNQSAAPQDTTVAPQDTTAPTQEQQAIQMQAELQAQQQTQQPTFTAQSQQPSTELENEAEEAQGAKEKDKAKKQYTSPMFLTPTTAYSSPLNNPFLTSSNNNDSMANPYGSMSAMSNPYENIYNNLYQTSNQQQVQNTDPNKFVYNPKA
ncbi:MAG TPA: hypothetical protein DCS44_03780 [Cyanobacteria bacterium UBA10660]|nr:MAG TPA: hypothetical protein CPT83_08790 [Candidatus Gastranaerophilales bacterium HUM_1]HAS93724.1 hypothetical protein [Cyanobacteria bacterium UBA10660]